MYFVYSYIKTGGLFLSILNVINPDDSICFRYFVKKCLGACSNLFGRSFLVIIFMRCVSNQISHLQFNNCTKINYNDNSSIFYQDLEIVLSVLNVLDIW